MKQGLVHIYTGEGKGKTTAALGLALRAVGCGCKVYFLQFFKDGLFPCGEAAAIKKFGSNFRFKRFNVPHPAFPRPVIARRTKPLPVIASPAKRGEAISKALKQARRIINSGEFDLVVLDEILIGPSQGFINDDILLDIIAKKPETVELVLTGRGASEKIMCLADYVTNMECLKHPYNNGIKARRAIEF
ncbi:MAG: cob(I)yrinic acid a,c-diamide adenosyltransferase [Candidatus Omnitrophica bacterium]|nr:cob(I)yrinic acid a,c-diamide adenosyltransferase [Candidatus Omnitrophota bacterium]